VTLTIEREVTDDQGAKSVEEKEYTLVRKEIPVTTVKGWKKTGAGEDAWDWFIDPESKIGYVRLTQFAEETDGKLGRAIAQMKGAGLNGLVLDLRYNPGGLLDQAVAVTSRFVSTGDGKAPYNGNVVTTHTKDNALVNRERLMEDHDGLGAVPMVVLINEGAASASEIVSGAIQDYARAGQVKAVLIGARSYGKGSVQNVWQLPAQADAAVKVTTQYYHLPGGRMIHKRPEETQWGVDPDLKVEMLPTQISEALILRQNADVLKLEQNGKTGGTEDSADPEDLINKGIDLQLQEALVILQAEVAAAAADHKALVERPGERPTRP
jgi:carboxyl-terminal processing protease